MFYYYNKNKINFVNILNNIFKKNIATLTFSALRTGMATSLSLILAVTLPCAGCTKNADKASETIKLSKKTKKPYIPDKYLKWQKGLDLSRKKAREPLYNRFVAEGGMSAQEEDNNNLMPEQAENNQFQQSVNQKIRAAIND
jgi:hypothetical protein